MPGVQWQIRQASPANPLNPARNTGNRPAITRDVFPEASGPASPMNLEDCTMLNKSST
jgi:hypothetical protein